MPPFIANTSIVLGVLTIAAQVISAVILAAFIYRRVTGDSVRILEMIAPRALLFSFIVALTATLGSLFYSNVAGFPPCELCWFQRIFMYPLVIIAALALAGRDYFIRRYVLTLASVGLIVSVYQNYIIYGGKAFTTCTATAGAVSCSLKIAVAFGYMTIPLMALSAFVLIILLMTVTPGRNA